MPMDARRKTNRGVAFVNLISPEVADKFFHVFNGLELPVPGGCEKPLVIAAAEVQGFAENAAKHADGAADKRAAGSPLFLRPAPQRPPARAPPAPPALALPLAGAVAARPAEEPSRAAPQHAESRFCGYCGQGRRTMDHAFCPFCGGRFC
ncbi:unnamed protein product [Prorocentrum cordatum]|uniref:RRM domain-containing protein n=1 Tax=Prorocentrum cordatum TaxID=2364126 RepID=A0ABN9PY28_9DINO|nr:unnamed protein product [Polarella glacialis]